jgi:hypothetical protein
VSALEWRYLRDSTRRHAVEAGSHIAICGIGPVWYKPDHIWYGAGTPAEVEHAELLPTCKRCLKGGAQP